MFVQRLDVRPAHNKIDQYVPAMLNLWSAPELSCARDIQLPFVRTAREVGVHFESVSGP
jgi:hypothetical protein